jgi:DNA-binding LytR/AlgR family response regulator
MARLLERVRTQGFGERALLGLCGAAAMSVIQSVFHMASCRVAPIEGLAPMTVPEAVLAAIISFTYFAGWTGMHLALLYHHQGQAERAPAQPQLPVPPEEAPEPVFWAARGRQLVRVAAAEILWVEAQKDYVQLHAAGGGGMLRETLGALQAKLDPALFIRVHRSAIVRRSEVAAIKRKPSGALSLCLASGAEVPVGRSYAKGLRDLVERMQGAAQT